MYFVAMGNIGLTVYHMLSVGLSVVGWSEVALSTFISLQVSLTEGS